MPDVADIADAPDPPDSARCPLCGEPNACALAAGRGAEAPPPGCWCRAERFPEALLARVPAEARNRACICRACLRTGQPTGSGAP